MTSNTITVCTTIDGARIGDDLVATSRHNAASNDRGRFVDIRIDALILETANGRRTVFAHEDWTFTVAPSAPPRVEAVEAWQGEPTAFEEHAAGLAASRLERVQELEAEVARLTALAENKQTVINEDREDAKRNRGLANQRADELVARIQELEVEAARHENALEKADGLIQALRRRYGTHVVLQRAQADDDRAARLIREADEQNSAARALAKKGPRTGGDPTVWALAPDAAGPAFAGAGTALDALNTFQLEPTADKFAKFLHIVDLGEYTKVLERAAREMATEEQAGVEAVLNQILIELRRLGKRADTRARAARKASIR